MNEEILRYLDNEMSQAERLAFEAALENDTSLNEEYKILLASKKVSSKFLETEIRAYFTKMDSESPTKSTSSNTQIVIIGVLLAALCVLGYFVLSKPKNKPNPTTQDFAMAYEEPIWPIVRGDENILSKAAALHLDGKTDTAIQLLSNKKEMTDEEKYWAAEILVNAKNCQKAKIFLDQLDAMKPQEPRIDYLLRYCSNQ